MTRTIFPEISPTEAFARLADPTPPVFLDLRLAEDVAAMPGRIPGAVAVAHMEAERQLALSQGRGAVVICHEGLKISAGVTARLRARGIAAFRLRGGHVAWTAARLPVVLEAPEAIALPMDAAMNEVLHAWAAKRFLCPQAELLPVPRADLDGVCARFGAVAAADLSVAGLPGLEEVRQAGTAGAAFLTLCRDGSDCPSALFPILDAAFRGALCHAGITGQSDARRVASGSEDAR